MFKKFIVVALILSCSAGITALTAEHHIVGRDVGGTKGLLSYSNVENNELLRPSNYLQAGAIYHGGKGICTAVNSLPTEARGWPFYFSIDDPNCGSTNIFPVLFMLDMLLFAVVTGLALTIVRRVVKL